MENQQNITVFEATGKVGRELLKLLSEAQIPTIAVTEDRKKVKDMPFIEWIQACPGDKDRIASIMQRTKSVFLAMELGDHYLEEQNMIIQAAEDSGVGHIVKLSSPAADQNSSHHFAKILGLAEERLKASVLKWTILQPNAVMQIWLGDFSLTVKKERRIYRATGNGKRAYIDARDIAEVTFKALTEPGKHIGETYVLTGAQTINYAEIAAAIGKIVKKEVIFISLTPDQAKKRMEEKGMSDLEVKTILAVTGRQCNGEAAFINNNVEEILQKPARTIEVFLNDHANWFR